METNDYKWVLFEIITSLKAKSTYLKSIDAKDPSFNQRYFEGMASAYYTVMDELKSIAINFDLDLDEFGLNEYDPSEILDYTPLNISNGEDIE